MREAVRTIALALLFAAAPTAARAQLAPAPAPPGPQFLSRFDFRMWANALAHEDPRFTWDTHWTGDFDLIDYVAGRVSFLADYQALLGEEFRPFDPYQSNYYLAVSASVRGGRTEYVFVFHHVSRHLGDRPKRDSVAMNAMLGRVLRRLDAGGATIDLRADAGPVVERAWVDYTWMATGDVVARRPVTPVVAVYARAAGETYGVDRAIAGRGQQSGGRLEGGVRFAGQAGAVELFGGFERTVDADPLDRIARQWAFAGFRLMGR